MIRWLSIICVALLVGATALRADIIHSPTNFILGYVWQGAEYFDLDLDADGTVDFSLQASLNYFAGIHSENDNQYLIHPSPPPNIGGPVAALSAGYLISPASGGSEEWFGIDDWATIIRKVSTGTAGEFIRTRGFIGLEFESSEGTHYGWLDIEGVPNGGSYLIVHGWAYETTPGASIVAGAVPEPSSVFLVFLGAFTLWGLKFRKDQRAHPAES